MKQTILLSQLIAASSVIAKALTSDDQSKELDLAQAQISRQLSLASYCGKEEYESFKFSGDIEGFEWFYTIQNGWYHGDVSGFIGYLPSDKSIYIAFEGSETIGNWITDLDAIKSKYSTWPECDCSVHGGFQDAANSVH